MIKIKDSVFQKSTAQDDEGLEKEAESLLVKILDGSIDILPTGPQTGIGKRVLVLSDGSAGFVVRNVLLRRLFPRGAASKDTESRNN